MAEPTDTLTLDSHSLVTPSARRNGTPALDMDHQRDVLARLKRIEGQLRGIRKMIE
jgi:hypothetical protein